MPDRIFDTESTQKQLDRLRELPPEEGGFGAVVEGDDVGVRGTWHKDIGKKGGWTFATAGSWMRKQKARAEVWFNWKGGK